MVFSLSLIHCCSRPRGNLLKLKAHVGSKSPRNAIPAAARRAVGLGEGTGLLHPTRWRAPGQQLRAVTLLPTTASLGLRKGLLPSLSRERNLPARNQCNGTKMHTPATISTDCVTLEALLVMSQVIPKAFFLLNDSDPLHPSTA